MHEVARPQLIVDFIADYVCPWCWVGRYRLEEALRQLRETRPDVAVRVSLRPFEINPDLPTEGMGRNEYAVAKFGSIQQARSLWGRVAAVAALDGLKMCFDAILRQPNTFDAHRLVAWAGTRKRGLALSARLYPAFFREGADLGDRATLARLAAEVGLLQGEAAAFLTSDTGVGDTRRMEGASRRGGIDAVPAYLFNRKTSVIGAQPIKRLREAMEQALS